MKRVIPALCMLIIASSVSQAAERPNVVVILTDDQGWGDLSINGNTNLQTPNIDQLARDGARFDRFYVCPVCSPTRAEFLTGRHHARSGVFSTSAGGERMNLGEVTIGDIFKSAGYRTAAFGKWHNGMQYPYHPNGRGFDEYYGFCSGHWANYYSPMLEHNGKIVRGDGFVIDDFTNKAMEFIEESVTSKSGEPFFAYLPYNTPHSPMQVPDRWWDKFKDKELEMHHREPEKENLPHIRAALAMCENIDWNVGRLLKKLDDLGVADNTIVVYFCDNGPNGTRWNDDMRGRKGSTDEGGVRSPLFVKWPGKIEPGLEVKQLSSVMDLLPTLAEMCRVPLANEEKLDGSSLAQWLLGRVDVPINRVILSHWRGRISARTPTHRLDHQGRLYDMTKDPGQRVDVSKDLPDVTADLKRRVEAFRSDVVDGYDQFDRPFLIGHEDYTYTQMPARDAIPHGEIKRSNRFPNCSYFFNWTSTDEKITWDVEVAHSGKYAVEVYYACPKSDVGATIRLTLNDESLSARVKKSHDPPFIGTAQDRVKRVEGDIRYFKSMTLGTMDLKKGSGVLTLDAPEIPGSQAMEMRLLMFTKVE